MAQNYWRERSKPYSPGQTAPYKVSRSKIELFMQCPRCFWLDVRLKITRPSGPPFNINKTIDELFKKEFDSYRAKGEPHPIMIKHKLQAIPYADPRLEDWRNTFVGIIAVHKPTNLHVFGGVDVVWVNPEGELIVVDYKATSKATAVSIDADWQISYKRQLEVYQWLLRANGYRVSPTGYFVYANGRLDQEGFFDKIDFRTTLIPYQGDDSWVDTALVGMKQIMDSDQMPAVGTAAMGGSCDFCAYARARTELTLESIKSKK